jgi:bacterioferritin-associated ferredoxin
MRPIRIYNQSTVTASPQTLAAMIVCVCHRVSDREIARHVRAGLGFDDIQLELGVATQCGQCEGCARDVVAQCSASHPVAALHCDSGSVPIQLASTITEGRAWNSSQHLALA